jgi:nicotinamide-nucleotide amidase
MSAGLPGARPASQPAGPPAVQPAVPLAGGSAAAPASAAVGLAFTAIGLLVASGQTAGTAESLTGGLVAAALTAVPGASAVFRGGVVAYAADVKASLLDVPASLLDRYGTVHRDVAVAMAHGARRRLDAAIGVATTGVAGPDPVDGQPAGTVHVAVVTAAGPAHRALALAGDRQQIRQHTVEHALRLLISALQEEIT